uniref:uncharacterized protein LOC120341914 n=1 Tax=Styela clava TaxID=7725 RepID=UPI00193A33B4|nr:uncharacterized protein LOC120341914 [Styela clava]
MGLSTRVREATPQNTCFRSSQLNNIEEAVAVCDSLLADAETSNDEITFPSPDTRLVNAEQSSCFPTTTFHPNGLSIRIPFPVEGDLAMIECAGNRHNEKFPAMVRSTGSRKEKKRTECINNAFSELRKRIPNVPMDTKLSKIKTLRLATSYIAYLTDILQNADPSNPKDGRDFRADLKALRTRERRRHLCQTDVSGKHAVVNGQLNLTMDEETPNNAEKLNLQGGKKRKGRTGWPEAVWAMELGNNVTQSVDSFTSNSEIDTHTSTEIVPTRSITQNVPFSRLVEDTDYSEETFQNIPQRFYVFNGAQNYAPVQSYTSDISNVGTAQTIHSIGVVTGNGYGQKDDYVSPFSYPAITLPAASSFSRRLPPIPRLRHEEERGVEIQKISEGLTSTDFDVIRSEFTDLEKGDHCSHSTPRFAELKTVSVASIKISTSAISGYGTFTSTDCADSNLQCMEATPVFGCLSSE